MTSFSDSKAKYQKKLKNHALPQETPFRDVVINSYSEYFRTHRMSTREEIDHVQSVQHSTY